MSFPLYFLGSRSNVDSQITPCVTTEEFMQRLWILQTVRLPPPWPGLAPFGPGESHRPWPMLAGGLVGESSPGPAYAVAAGLLPLDAV